jgi:hypothetical protein
MKNYLFAPFKNNDEKKEEFKYLNKTWNLSSDVIVFIGQLESYYDNIITELNKRIEICKDNHERYDIKAIDENTELKAELEKVKRCNKTMDGIIIERDAEIKRLNDDYNNDHKVHNEYEDGLLEEIKELKADIKRISGKE